jgi:hypothetical protein
MYIPIISNMMSLYSLNQKMDKVDKECPKALEAIQNYGGALPENGEASLRTRADISTQRATVLKSLAKEFAVLGALVIIGLLAKEAHQFNLDVAAIPRLPSGGIMVKDIMRVTSISDHRTFVNMIVAVPLVAVTTLTCASKATRDTQDARIAQGIAITHESARTKVQ